MGDEPSKVLANLRRDFTEIGYRSLMLLEIRNHDERRQNDRKDTCENPKGHLFLLDVRKNKSTDQQNRPNGDARYFQLEKSDGEGCDGQIYEPGFCDRRKIGRAHV